MSAVTITANENTDIGWNSSTHSYDNIIGAVEGVKDCPEDFSFYRLGYDKDVLKAFRSSYDLLKSALRSDMEVR